MVIVKKIKDFFADKHKLQGFVLITIIFLLNLFFVVSRLTPGLYEINPHDEAKYIESGRLLLHWGLRDLAWGPLVAFIYAPLHLVVGNSPNWFLIEAWAGNIILFALLWFAFYAMARELQEWISRIVFIGLLFSTPVFFPILENQSDALFIALSSFALLFLIRFHKSRKIKNLGFASLFVGLGILSRVETILLVFPLLFFALLFNKKQNKGWKVIVASTAPIIILLSLFVLTNLLTFGHPNLGMGGKSFESFEMNQAFLPGSKNEQDFLRGEAIFGSVEEHRGSVFRAILMHPLPTIERAAANLLNLPESFISFFGRFQAPIILVFLIWGVYKLMAANKGELTLLLLIWPIQAFVSLIFLSRHIIPQMSHVILMLCAIGITQFFSSKTRKIERIFLFGAAALMMLAAFITENKYLIASCVLLAGVSLISLFWVDKGDKGKCLQEYPLMLLLIGVLLFGEGFVFPAKFIGRSQEEAAVQQLQLILPEQSKVLTPIPTIAIAARMTPEDLPADVIDVEGLLDFIASDQIESIYIDERWQNYSEFIRSVINIYPEKFNLIYESENQSIEVYLTSIKD
jgi:hypothetical protein